MPPLRSPAYFRSLAEQSRDLARLMSLREQAQHYEQQAAALEAEQGAPQSY
jgi:hypothetical protein